MLFFFDQDDQVSGRSASFAGIAPSPHAQLHSFLYSCGNIDRDGLFSIYPAFSLTGVAFCSYQGTFAVTGGTGRNGLHLSEESIADFSHLATAATGAAGLYAAFVPGAIAATGGASALFLSF